MAAIPGLVEAPFDAPSSLWRRTGRTLTRRNVGIAAAIGSSLGAIQGLGYLLFASDRSWVLVADPIVGGTAQALLLLLALAIAANVEMSRLPRWLPFAMAMVAATVGVASIEWILAFVDAIASGAKPDTTGMDVAQYAWNRTPYLLITGTFAMFGAMQAQDVARRDGALRRLRMEQTRVARATYEAQLVALQARVEPRFLFDTLSDVEIIYEREPGLGARIMDELIVYLRAALPTIDDTSSSLNVELTLVANWLDIVRIRTGNRLAFVIEDEAPRDARLPPMVLLPLVQHAAEDGTDLTRAIFVETASDGGRIRVTVIGPAAAFAPSSPSPAVQAVRERVDALYGDLARFTLQSVMHDRSQAILEIPYERTDRRPR
jgi:hypothetical protein